MSSTNFGKETTAEEVATALKGDIQGKNSECNRYPAQTISEGDRRAVLLVGATVKSLGAEFLRVVAPYAKNIWVAGRSIERFVVLALALVVRGDTY